MTDSPERDQRALGLRCADSSCARVATDLGYERTAHAVEAFNCAVRRSHNGHSFDPGSWLVSTLWRTRFGLSGSDDGELARCLGTVEHLRTRLLAP
jgi:hypothetical protein